MFTIDLLKGKGLPVKSDIKRTVLKAVPMLIPVMMVGMFVSSYSQKCILVNAKETAIKQNDLQIEELSGCMREYSKVNSRISEMRKCVDEISKALSYRVQMSDMILELINILPGGIFISEMEMDRQLTNEKYVIEATNETKQRPVVHRKLVLELGGFQGADSDQAMQEYVEALKQSPMLSSTFREIKPASRHQAQLDKKTATFYTIECMFYEQR